MQNSVGLMSDNSHPCRVNLMEAKHNMKNNQKSKFEHGEELSLTSENMNVQRIRGESIFNEINACDLHRSIWPFAGDSNSIAEICDSHDCGVIWTSRSARAAEKSEGVAHR
jgi:hypothetical protein